jgi:signal transduction histidine kinase
MQARLSQLGGRCTIESAMGEGTKVEFFLPLRS